VASFRRLAAYATRHESVPYQHGRSDHPPGEPTAVLTLCPAAHSDRGADGEVILGTSHRSSQRH
jgi:hypothetical protein